MGTFQKIVTNLNKRLILLTKCSWRKVGLRERRSRGDSWRKVLLFGRKNVKKTFSLAFFKKILFQNISWYTDIFASVPLHAPPPPCQYFLSVPLVVKQNRQMSSQLVSKASARDPRSKKRLLKFDSWSWETYRFRDRNSNVPVRNFKSTVLPVGTCQWSIPTEAVSHSDPRGQCCWKRSLRMSNYLFLQWK